MPVSEIQFFPANGALQLTTRGPGIDQQSVTVLIITCMAGKNQQLTRPSYAYLEVRAASVTTKLRCHNSPSWENEKRIAPCLLVFKDKNTIVSVNIKRKKMMAEASYSTWFVWLSALNRNTFVILITAAGGMGRDKVVARDGHY